MSFEALILFTLPFTTSAINHILGFLSLNVSVQPGLAIDWRGEDMQEDHSFTHQKIYLFVQVCEQDTPIDPSRPVTFS